MCALYTLALYRHAIYTYAHYIHMCSHYIDICAHKRPSGGAVYTSIHKSETVYYGGALALLLLYTAVYMWTLRTRMQSAYADVCCEC